MSTRWGACIGCMNIGGNMTPCTCSLSLIYLSANQMCRTSCDQYAIDQSNCSKIGKECGRGSQVWAFLTQKEEICDSHLVIIPAHFGFLLFVKYLTEKQNFEELYYRIFAIIPLPTEGAVCGFTQHFRQFIAVGRDGRVVKASAISAFSFSLSFSISSWNSCWNRCASWSNFVNKFSLLIVGYFQCHGSDFHFDKIWRLFLVKAVYIKQLLNEVEQDMRNY